MVSHKHPPSLGGMETQNYFIAEGLKQSHQLVEVIFKGPESRLTFFRKVKSRVRKVLKDHPDIDLIHLNDGLMAFLLHWLPAYTNKPIITTFHGLDLIFPSSFYQKRLKKFTANHCYSICVSEATKREAIQRGFQINNVIHIDNGVDHDFAKNKSPLSKTEISKNFELPLMSDKSKLLISVGRAVPRKGFSWFIKHVFTKLDQDTHYIIIGPNNVTKGVKRIFKILPKKWARFIATLNGFTTDYRRAQDAIQANGLSKRVKFLDAVPFEGMVKLLLSADLFIMPNKPFAGDMEGFGLVILEANMCNKFVLGSNIEGITSAIHEGENGNLLPPLDQEAWIQKTSQLLADSNALKIMGTQAKEYATQHFGWDKMVDDYIAYFEQINEKQAL